MVIRARYARPKGSVHKWHQEQLFKFIRSSVEHEGLGWLEVVDHAGQRMDERFYDANDLLETLLLGSPQPAYDGRDGDRRIKFVYRRRTGEQSVIVSLDDNRPNGFLITVLPKKHTYK